MARQSSAIQFPSLLLSLFLSQILYPLSSVFSRSVRPLCSNPLTYIFWIRDAMFSSTTVMHSEQRNRKDIKLIKIVFEVGTQDWKRENKQKKLQWEYSCINAWWVTVGWRIIWTAYYQVSIGWKNNWLRSKLTPLVDCVGLVGMLKKIKQCLRFSI